jgi:beta-xylosidase
MSKSADTFENPLPDLRMGDPFVARIDQEAGYLLTGTTDANRGFRAWRSADLVNWQPAGWLWQRPPAETGDDAMMGQPESSIWAPEVFTYGGKWYLIFSAKPALAASEAGENGPKYRLFLAEADKPFGPYRLHSAPWLDDGHPVIDAHVFVDIGNDGSAEAYAYFVRVMQPDAGGRPQASVWGVRLSEDLQSMVGEPVECASVEQDWESSESSLSICNEGPFVFREGKRYYLIYSAGHWAEREYAIGYAVSDLPLGPWVKPNDNPLLSAGMVEGLSGPGHASVTLSPNGAERWLVYHAHANPENPRGPRTVNLGKLIVTEAGRLEVEGLGQRVAVPAR